MIDVDITMDVTPDDSATVPDETRITFTFPCTDGAGCVFSGSRSTAECANEPTLGTDPLVSEATHCGVSIQPGDTVRFGMVASVEAGRTGVDADHMVEQLSFCR